MKLTSKQKYEIKSIIQTFLAIFIPLAAVSFQSVNYDNLTKETFTALAIALLRSAIKVLWQVVATKLATN
jgi:hypothetical protein